MWACAGGYVAGLQTLADMQRRHRTATNITQHTVPLMVFLSDGQASSGITGAEEILVRAP